MTALVFLAIFIAVSVSLAAIMTGAWLAWRSTRNSGWIDTTWTFGLGAVGCAGAFTPSLVTGGVTTRQAAGGGPGRGVVAPPRPAHRAAHHRHHGRSALRQDDRRMGRRRVAADVLPGAKAGAGQHSAGAVDGACGLESVAGFAPAGCARRRGPDRGHRRRGHCPTHSCGVSAPIRPTAIGFATSGYGAGRGIRIISSNGSAGSLIRCSPSISAAPTVGLGGAGRAGLHVLAVGARLRHSAARGAHAGAPARRIPRLSGAHQRVLSRRRRGPSEGADHEPRADDDRLWRKRAAARRGDAGGDQAAGRADAAAAVARRQATPTGASHATWRRIRSRSTPPRPTPSTTKFRRSSSLWCSGRSANTRPASTMTASTRSPPRKSARCR